MALEVTRDCEFIGPALPEPFVLFELEAQLNRLGILPKALGEEGAALRRSWEVYRRGLRALGPGSGSIRIRNHVLEPLTSRLGYDHLARSEAVPTREEPQGEAGGHVLTAGARNQDSGVSRLRVWTADFAADLEAPVRRGAAYRYSALQIARRVLLASNERVGLVTNGVELRLVLSDPARRDSQVVFSLDNWRRYHQVPDSFRLLLALCSPKGVGGVPELTDRARLMQAQVTKDLRVQARQAIERFVQEVLDHPANTQALLAGNREVLPRELWREGLVLIYRLLFILKLEGSPDPARVFSFASSSLWRNTFSPSAALAPVARQVLDAGAETGSVLEEGLRALFRMFVDGVDCTELRVRPLGGALFGKEATPWLSRLQWGERAVAHLLDRLLWTETKREGRKRVHYGPLDVEDLGRVYEALLELEPGIAAEPMCRLRRAKLEVVVPVAQGERYRAAAPVAASAGPPEVDERDEVDEAEAEPYEQEDDATVRGKKTKVEWIEEIPEGRFYLRVGLGRKSSGSYYTPDSFVRFLVQETLGPQVEEQSPHDNPDPGAILRLRVLDTAMGSGHFLVGACRFLADKLYEAARLCDERATEAERKAETSTSDAERCAARTEADQWRRKVLDLPDAADELAAYMPSRAPEGEESGLSQARALAICRRLVAVHCLYGVDKNPLAVELAKLSLWLESQAEGFPLTFLDHRLVVGDSLTGPFWTDLVQYPGSGKQMAHLWIRNGEVVMAKRLQEALRYVGLLEENVGKDPAENARKAELKRALDRSLAPLRVLAAAWAGGVMLGPARCDDDAYEALAEAVMDTGDLPAELPAGEAMREMLARGFGVDRGSVPSGREALYRLSEVSRCVPALSYDLTFPEVFYPTGVPWDRRGFDAVIGNPPWDRMLPADKEFFAGLDLRILDAPTKGEREAIQRRLSAEPATSGRYVRYLEGFRSDERVLHRLYLYQVAEVHGEKTIGKQDAYRAFMERKAGLLGSHGRVGVLVPSAFHANEGATGVRRLYIEDLTMVCCFSFENRRKLFEIDSRFKFATVIARRQCDGPDTFSCRFYLQEDSWLHGTRSDALAYTRGFVQRTGGEYLSLLELRSARDLAAAEVCFDNGEAFAATCVRIGVQLGRELNMTDDAARFTQTARVLAGTEDPRDPETALALISAGYLVLHEGKTFHQYTDRWEDRPRYVVKVADLVEKAGVLRAVPFYRAAYRDIARSNDERTAIFALLPPGVVIGDTAKAPERLPEGRPHSYVLSLLAVCNSYPTDFLVRLRGATHVSLFMMNGTPMPPTLVPHRFLAHCCLRLSCNHTGYAPLWCEQVGDTWREPTPHLTWPVLHRPDERWELRAAIDAVVAEAYGLSQAQYAHVLSTFSHTSYPKAPELCLAKFDELKAIGIDAFTRKYDPYHDIPLNENLPQPVIELLVPGASTDGPTNLLGEPLPVNLLGEVEYGGKRRGKGRRGG